MKRSTSKKKIVQILAIVLAVLLLAGSAAVLLSTVANAAEPVFELTELDRSESYLDPIPLLCIRISFDANGNGVDDWDPYNPTKLTSDKNADYYGEQWIHSGRGYWAEILFGNNRSLYNYYREVSNNHFWFYAGSETQGVENDGIVDVVINMAHPRSKSAYASNFTADGGERRAALIEASKYVDFKSYDTDENGYVDYDELAIVFILAGYEHAYGTKTNMNAFGTHAHYTAGSGISVGGVIVTASGHSGFVKCGEYQTASDAITYGTAAHELGHFLGSADLYDGGDGAWTYFTAQMSLMSSGSHGSKANERRGASPAALDPFHLIYTGLCGYTTVLDGEYTLYAHTSTEGDYNILRINTQNPSEYYLIENRSKSDKSKSDANASEGVVVWHIDESIVNMGKVNTTNSGHDPGVVVLGPNGIIADSCGFAYKEGAAASRYTFTAMNKKYVFPKSGTWNTSLDEGEELPLTIEVLDGVGTEMRIRVSGSVECAPSVSLGKSTDAKVDSLTFYGSINDLCGGNVTSCGFILSKNEVPTAENGTVIYAIPNPDGTFEATFEGLTQGTKYYCTVFATGKFGTGSRTYSTYTKFPPREDVEYDYYFVYVFPNYMNMARKYTRRVYPGEKMTYVPEYEWAGYQFAGWFWDAELTEKYDMNYTQQTKENFSLYGKWIRNEVARKLTIVGAETLFNFAAEIGSTFIEPIPVEREGYTFGGWYADEDRTVPFDFDSTVQDEETVIYAKWISDTPEPTTEPTTEPSEPTAEPTVAPTEEPTTEPTTETPETTTGVEETTKAPSGGGCGSLIAGGAAVIFASATLGVTAVRKKKK